MNAPDSGSSEPGFAVRLGVETSGAREIPDDRPFHVAVIGDFSGRGNRGECRDDGQLASIRPLEVDRDDLEQRMDRLRPRLENLLVDPDGHPVSVEFRELDDFHPDALFERAEVFEKLRRLRDRLFDPGSYAAAAREVLSWQDASDPEETERRPDAGSSSSESSPGDAAPGVEQPGVEQPVVKQPDVEREGLLDAILAGHDSGDVVVPPTAEEADPWRQLIRDLVAPHVRRGADPRQDELVGYVDAAVNRLMSRLLQHPDFQRLESAWRSLYWLVRHVETGPRLRIFLIDVSVEELTRAVGASGEASRSPAAAWLGSPQALAGGVPYSVVTALLTAEADRNLHTIGQLAKIAEAGRFLLLASAGRSIAGCADPARQPSPESWDPAVATPPWRQLRQSSAASHAALLWPRYLMRLPYGPDTSPIESFAMTEEVESPESLLWGPTPILVAGLIAQSFRRKGWELNYGEPGFVDGLPVHLRRIDDQVEARPCGELLLDERAATELMQRGVSPLFSVRDRDRVEIRTLVGIDGRRIAGPSF